MPQTSQPHGGMSTLNGNHVAEREALRVEFLENLRYEAERGADRDELVAYAQHIGGIRYSGVFDREIASLVDYVLVDAVETRRLESTHHADDRRRRLQVRTA